MSKMINWMGGLPREGLVSASEWEERLAAAADRFPIAGSPDVAAKLSPQLLLHEILKEGLLKGKVHRPKANIRTARGADAVLNQLARHSLSEGDVVLVDRLTSRSALQIFRKTGARIEAVAGDEQGMDPEALKHAISRSRPRLVFTSPAGSDPEGRVWPRQRIQDVTAMCRISGVLLLRDDRQEMLIYDDRRYSAEFSGYGEACIEEGVLSIGQLPPGLIAGLGFGWVAGHRKNLQDWMPDTRAADKPDRSELLPLECRAIADLLQEQPLADQIDMLRVQCRARMRRITELLEEQQPPRGLQWRNPEGGMHLWLTLPEGLDGEALLRAAWLRGVMFQPGAPFYAAYPKINNVRLTFADSDERRLKLGTQRLFETIGDFLGRSS